MRYNPESMIRLVEIMDTLRVQCPWDKKQTFESLRQLTIEEVYELSEAILSGNRVDIAEELGDLLLHVVFYARLGEEEGLFTMESLTHQINEKLIRRHPHIYGDVQVKDEEEVKSNWEKIKKSEGKVSALEGVPKGLPAMIKAIRIQEKARKSGFDWDEPKQVWEKVMEELSELQLAIAQNAQGDKHEQVMEELGDALFALINYARFIQVNPEDALEKTNQKFMRRFQYMEERSKEAGKSLDQWKLEELDVWWNEAKQAGL